MGDGSTAGHYRPKGSVLLMDPWEDHRIWGPQNLWDTGKAQLGYLLLNDTTE